jgi:hypothetical protein
MIIRILANEENDQGCNGNDHFQLNITSNEIDPDYTKKYKEELN